MVASSIFALCIILSNVVNPSYCRKIHRKPPHQHEIPNAAKDIQMVGLLGYGLLCCLPAYVLIDLYPKLGYTIACLPVTSLYVIMS